MRTFAISLCLLTFSAGCAEKTASQNIRTAGHVVEIVGGVSIATGAVTMTAAAGSPEITADTSRESAIAVGAAIAVAGSALALAGYLLTLEADGASRRERIEAARKQAAPSCADRMTQALVLAGNKRNECSTVCQGQLLPDVELAFEQAKLRAQASEEAAKENPADAARQATATADANNVLTKQRDLALCRQSIPCIQYEAALTSIQANAWCSH